MCLVIGTEENKIEALLQITIGLCFSSMQTMYQGYTGSIVQLSVSTDVMMSLTTDHEARKTRCFYAKLYSTQQ